MRYPLGTLILAGTMVATAPSATAQARIACHLSVLVADPDPNGMNVRAAPTRAAQVLRVIPNNVGGVADVREQRGAWLRVTRISDAEADTTLFEGDGWVHSSLLGLTVANGDTRLYAAPDRRSRVLRTLVADETPITLIGCLGQWAKVRAAGRVGWLSPEGQCSNPLTTCA